jgi:hypothetical protein
MLAQSDSIKRRTLYYIAIFYLSSSSFYLVFYNFIFSFIFTQSESLLDIMENNEISFSNLCPLNLLPFSFQNLAKSRLNVYLSYKNKLINSSVKSIFYDEFKQIFLHKFHKIISK